MSAGDAGEEPGLPKMGRRWRSLTVWLLGVVVAGLTINILSGDYRYRAVLAVFALAAVAAAVGWIRALPPRAPLARASIPALLGLAAPAAFLALVAPRSWAGPATLTATVLVAAAVLIPSDLKATVKLLSEASMVGGLAVCFRYMATSWGPDLWDRVSVLANLGVMIGAAGAIVHQCRKHPDEPANGGGLVVVGLGGAVVGSGIAVLSVGKVLAGVAVAAVGVPVIGLGLTIPGVGRMSDRVAPIATAVALIGSAAFLIGLGTMSLLLGLTAIGVVLVGLGVGAIGFAAAILRRNRLLAGWLTIGVGVATIGVGIGEPRTGEMFATAVLIVTGVATIGLGILFLQDAGLFGRVWSSLIALTREPSPPPDESARSRVGQLR